MVNQLGCHSTGASPSEVQALARPTGIGGGCDGVPAWVRLYWRSLLWAEIGTVYKCVLYAWPTANFRARPPSPPNMIDVVRTSRFRPEKPQNLCSTLKPLREASPRADFGRFLGCSRLVAIFSGVPTPWHCKLGVRVGVHREWLPQSSWGPKICSIPDAHFRKSAHQRPPRPSQAAPRSAGWCGQTPRAARQPS